MKILLSLLCATISLIVKNTGDTQRQEVAEADLQTICQQLGSDTDDPLIVRNAFGQEMTYQKTYDGKLLLYVVVQPGSEAVFTIEKGEPSSFKSYVKGKCYPERADDITWENVLTTSLGRTTSVSIVFMAQLSNGRVNGRLVRTSG